MRFDQANLGAPGFSVDKFRAGRWPGGRRLQTHGVSLYYRTFGAGPPVLVLHGGLGYLETMHAQTADLARDHLVIAPDSRGQGRSSDGAGPLRYADMADDMVALLDRLHVLRADVVGWSDGGIIGLDMAMRYPDRVRRVVAIGANSDPTGLSVMPSAADAGGAAAPAAPASYRRLSPDPAHWPVFYNRLIEMWRTQPHYSAADLARIRAPVLIMAGDHDVIRREHTDALARAIPGAREVILPGVGHDGPMTAPGPVNAAVRRFLTGTS